MGLDTGGVCYDRHTKELFLCAARLCRALDGAWLFCGEAGQHWFVSSKKLLSSGLSFKNSVSLSSHRDFRMVF